jgi:TPR repeat protein
MQTLAAGGRALFGEDKVKFREWLKPLAQQLKNQSSIKVVHPSEDILTQRTLVSPFPPNRHFDHSKKRDATRHREESGTKLAFARKSRHVGSMDTSWVKQLFKRPAGAGSESTQSLADHGDAEAQFRLGLSFASGGPAKVDYAKAAHWYLLAANQNHALAQFNLGLMFAGGQGVAQDEGQARAWMRTAAQQGDAGAQHHLGMSYRRDSFEGKSKDALESNLEAYKWLHLAAAQGYRASESARNDIALGFTLAQVNEGNDRAKACRPARALPTPASP